MQGCDLSETRLMLEGCYVKHQTSLYILLRHIIVVYEDFPDLFNRVVILTLLLVVTPDEESLVALLDDCC